jgi:two-component system response regulator RegA
VPPRDLLVVDDVPPRDLLVVDDDRVLRERLARAFRDRGIEVRTAADFEEALLQVHERAPAGAVVDLRMPGRSGLELVRELREIAPATRIVVLTGYGSIATAVEAIRAGAVHYLAKPADADDVLAAFSREDRPTDEAAEPAAPSLARAEWEHINRVLADCDGNVSEAARRLGLHRRSLQRKLAKFPPKS